MAAAVESDRDGDEQGSEHAGAPGGDIQPTSADLDAAAVERVPTRKESSSVPAARRRPPATEQEDKTRKETC